MREVTIGVLLLGSVVLVGRAEQTGSVNADQPMVFDTFSPGPCSPNGQRHGGCPQGSLVRIRVVPVATGLVHPWHIAFLPEGLTILVSESPGRLRMIRNGTLHPQPISGWPPENLQARGLNSVLVHPQFAQNHYVYLSYPKAREPGTGTPTTLALARGRLEGTTLTDVRDIFVADSWQVGGALAGRAAFGPDGMIYLAAGDRDNRVLTDDGSARMSAQDLNSHVGKVLRLRDDGGVPADNPFVDRPGVKPEIYTYGHRNVYGFAWHPDTGALWACEIGPMGGDELNVLVPGRNYGWPLVSLGKIYTGKLSNDQSWYRPGMEMPVLYWMPAISPSSLIIYTGDRFPLWKGHFFIGALSGQQLQRVAFNQPPPQSERRESLLTQLDLRIRDVRQGPDGLIYIATEQPGETTAQVPIGGTDNPTGSILRIEPAD
jgi:glucose/arabinose dehydrogenase